jgi:hypothetical protein
MVKQCEHSAPRMRSLANTRRHRCNSSSELGAAVTLRTLKARLTGRAETQTTPQGRTLCKSSPSRSRTTRPAPSTNTRAPVAPGKISKPLVVQFTPGAAQVRTQPRLQSPRSRQASHFLSREPIDRMTITRHHLYIHLCHWLRRCRQPQQSTPTIQVFPVAGRSQVQARWCRRVRLL